MLPMGHIAGIKDSKTTWLWRYLLISRPGSNLPQHVDQMYYFCNTCPVFETLYVNIFGDLSFHFLECGVKLSFRNTEEGDVGNRSSIKSFQGTEENGKTVGPTNP